MTVNRLAIQSVSLKPEDRRRLGTLHIEGLASHLTTRADLIALASIEPELTVDSLAALIGAEAYHETKTRHAASTPDDFRTKAAIMLDPSRDHNERLVLSARQRASVIDAYGTLAMRASAR